MGYYVRVLSPTQSIIPASDLSTVLQSGTLTVEAGTAEEWEQLLLVHRDGREIAVIERNEVADDSLAKEEISEFIEELALLKPTSAAQWLIDYLPKVKIIYAFQVLSGVDEGDGWTELGAIKSKLWSQLGGILQADGEGFSNDAGYHIVWQFSERVSGPWWMGILGKDGSWTHFQMELGNRVQREQFLNGEVPSGVKFA